MTTPPTTAVRRLAFARAISLTGGAASFAAYTHTRNHLYSLENRWPHSVFWQKRRLIHNRPTDLSRSPIAVE